MYQLPFRSLTQYSYIGVPHPLELAVKATGAPAGWLGLPGVRLAVAHGTGAPSAYWTSPNDCQVLMSPPAWFAQTCTVYWPTGYALVSQLHVPFALKACFMTHVPLGFWSQNSYCALAQPLAVAVTCTCAPFCCGETGLATRPAL